jgi:hypothetical protein
LRMLSPVPGLALGTIYHPLPSQCSITTWFLLVAEL